MFGPDPWSVELPILGFCEESIGQIPKFESQRAALNFIGCLPVGYPLQKQLVPGTPPHASGENPFKSFHADMPVLLEILYVLLKEQS